MTLAAENVTVAFGHGRRAVTVLDDVSLTVPAGTSLGLVGESGSGKSTLAKAMVGLVRPRAGRVLLDGEEVSGLRGARLTAVRRRVQMVSQDPYSSLNPRMTVGRALAEALDPRRADVRAHAAAVARGLEAVALDADAARLRLYEVAGPALRSEVAPGDGDDLVRQVGVKIWADGSPWTGNLAASFPYLDTPATRMLGVPPGHRDRPNHTDAELLGLSLAYYTAGWQLACHANGDQAAEQVLAVWSELLARHPAPPGPPRLRMEHVSAMRPGQFARAHALGITCSLFPDHLHYWGEVIADDLFGPAVAERWAPVGTALATGMRVSLHNDSPVTPSIPCTTSASPPRGCRARAAGSGPASASASPRRCVPRPSTPPGSSTPTTSSAR